MSLSEIRRQSLHDRKTKLDTLAQKKAEEIYQKCLKEASNGSSRCEYIFNKVDLDNFRFKEEIKINNISHDRYLPSTYYLHLVEEKLRSGCEPSTTIEWKLSEGELYDEYDSSTGNTYEIRDLGEPMIIITWL
jgi:hypothetical protein